MLVFKSRRRVSPALRAENTPSERRVIQSLVRARREVESWIESNMTALMDAIAHRPWTTVADMIPDGPWYEFQEYMQGELLAEVVDAGFRATDGPVGKARTPLLGYRFDATRPEASAWAAREAGSMVTEITTGQRTLIRDLISRGQMEGITVDQTARTIRQTVGLTTQQAGWVDNFYGRNLAQNIGAGMSPSQAAARASTATSRYHDRIHRYRAETIARTEIARAASQGRQFAWDQGIEQGFISGEAQKEWIAEADACEICAPRNGQKHPAGKPWPDGDPPAHPNCRCDLLLIPEPVSGNFSQLSDAQLMDTIGGLLTGNLVPTVPTAGAQPLAPSVDDFITFPGARREFSYFADDDYARLARIADDHEDATYARFDPDNPFSGFSNEDKMLKAILDDQGFSGKGTVVDDATFDSLRRDDRFQYLGRGMADDDAATVSKYVDDLVDGEVYAGRGIFGNGTYMSGAEDVVQNFARKDAMGNDYAHGKIVDSLLRPNAKVIDFDDAYAQMSRETDNVFDRWGATRWASGVPDDAGVVIDDVGRWAAANGYDAVRIRDPLVGSRRLEGITYWNVLNRQALIFRRTARNPS
jgi:SPP1 gp7 family putative phage head morphogenesis protein